MALPTQVTEGFADRVRNDEIAQAQEKENDIIRNAGALVKNSNYQVIIKREASKSLRAIEIRANLPETFSFGVSANFESNLNSSFIEMASNSGIRPLAAFGEALKGVNNFTNVNQIVQEATFQVWSSSSPISFSLPLLFDAVSDAGEDVVAPIRDLMALTLPYRETKDALVLRPPGPHLTEPDHGRVSLKIGNMNYFHSVLLRDVSANFSSRFTSSGAPISAECDVTFETVNTPSQADIDLFFMYASRDVTQAEREEYGTLKGAEKRVNNTSGQVVENAKNGGWLSGAVNVIPGGGAMLRTTQALLGISPAEAGDFP
jgi:hypothetical protein